ncbi:MAG: hypothetical protein M1834_003799 [Cirrosporium novae-zelandiae]|nr:MAG: hypothetical protein M1834_003799 [Cirrosporium novae-zelandiae]
MMLSNPIFRTLYLSSLPFLIYAVDTTVDPALDISLFTAPTYLDAINEIPNSDSWVFDFNNKPFSTMSPGGVVNANRATFPAVVGNHLSVAMLNLGPCSLLPAHIHPRASNYVTAIKGTTKTYMQQENGAPLISTTLTPGKMTIFPQGSMHTMMNIGCEDAQLVSALSAEDPGTLNVFNNVFKFPPGFVAAAFGGPITAPNMPDIGTGAVWGNQECLAKCGISSSNGTQTYNATSL